MGFFIFIDWFVAAGGRNEGAVPFDFAQGKLTSAKFSLKHSGEARQLSPFDFTQGKLTSEKLSSKRAGEAAKILRGGTIKFNGNLLF